MIDETTVASLSWFDYLIPTAHAQTPTEYGPFDFGNNYVGPTTTGGGGSSSGGGGGGGSRSPVCRAFTATLSNAVVTLAWETERGDELTIEADGTKLFGTDDDAVVDSGTYDTDWSGNTTYVLTVKDGTRRDVCETEIDFAGGQGGPVPQVLGEQVSVVPEGGAHAGGGGASPLNIPAPSPLVAALTSLASRRKNG